MKYKLTLEVTDEQDVTREAFVAIHYPGYNYFTTNTLITNSLSVLVPLLVGDALSQFDDGEIRTEED